MNMQEVYTKVRKHLLAQGTPARSGANCLYRTSQGLSCAVGCLIDDEFYHKNFEGNNVDDDRILHALESSGIDLADGLYNRNNEYRTMPDMLGDLQAIHDSAMEEMLTPANDVWRRKLDQLAFDYNLKVEA